jgi:hypothetical protein
MPDGSGEGQTAKVVGNGAGGPKRVWKPVTRNQVHPDSAFHGSPRGVTGKQERAPGPKWTGTSVQVHAGPGVSG